MFSISDQQDSRNSIVVSSAPFSGPFSNERQKTEKSGAWIYDEEQLDCLLHLHSPLNEQQPDEFRRYLDLFYTYCRKRPFNVRIAYDRGFIQKNRKYKDGSGNYPAYCHHALIARHLDPDHWSFLHPDAKPTERYWVAMWAPKKSTLKVLDIDNKQNLLGYTQVYEGPLLPVVRIPLERFVELKRIYDEFLGHVWCISSETLGLHLWEKYPRPLTVEDIHKATRPRLKKIGITCEIHPMFGRCFRRPFGQDYVTITENGLLTDWIEQLNYFEYDAATPSFAAIYSALRSKLLEQWAIYERCGRPARSRIYQTKWIDVAALRRELEKIDTWAANGFPRGENSISIESGGPASPAGKQAAPTVSSSCEINLSDVCSRDWLNYCGTWARDGLPCEDSLFLVVSQLARWFYFVEFFHLPEIERLEKTKNLLVRFCMTKNNGFISRLAGGLNQEVTEHVHRVVQSGIDNADMQFKTYCAIMRQKREKGGYRQVIYLESILLGKEELSTLSSTVGFIMCPTKEADSTPLPDQMIGHLLDAYRATGRQPRRNTKTGQYPIIEKCTRFINALYASNGKRRLSQDVLRNFGFSANSQRELLKKLMVKAGIITVGSYRSKTASRVYHLTKRTMQELDCQRKPQSQQSAG